MALSSDLGAYADVDAVLSAALTEGGVRYTLPSAKAAIRFRQRAHYYRKLLYNQKLQELHGVPGIRPSTPYSGLIVRCEENVVVVTALKPEGELTNLAGAPVTPRENNDNDLLLEEALRLAEEQGDG